MKMLKNTEILKEYTENPYTLSLESNTTNIGQICQRWWPIWKADCRPHEQGQLLTSARISYYQRHPVTQPHGHYRAHRMNTDSTALQHTLTPDSSIVSILSQVKNGFQVPSEDFVSLLWAVTISCTPAVACMEPKGFHLPSVARRCQEV